jgi:cytochrome c-type biogenesis protein CcmE
MTIAPKIRPKKTKASLRKRRRVYLIIASMTVISLAVFLVLTAMEEGIQFYKDPTDIMENRPASGKNFRLGGLVVKGSFIKASGEQPHKFSVTDGMTSIKAEYKDLLPDLFGEGQGVVLEGSLNDQNIYIASKVLAKHDENYMPKEVVDSLKKRGVWQHEDDEKPATAPKDTYAPKGTYNNAVKGDALKEETPKKGQVK